MVRPLTRETMKRLRYCFKAELSCLPLRLKRRGNVSNVALQRVVTSDSLKITIDRYRTTILQRMRRIGKPPIIVRNAPSKTPPLAQDNRF